jgi:hypothetical protein
MKITYDTINKNLTTYSAAKAIFPAIAQFEKNEIDYSAMHSLGLGKFADFSMFLKSTKVQGFDPISSTKSFRTLKPIIVEMTTTERFKTFIKNRTQKKFDAIFNDSDLFDRLLNGPWKSRPQMRRNGRMGYGTRKNERVEGLQTAIVPIINYIILNDIDVHPNIADISRGGYDRISNSTKWYTGEVLSFEKVPQKEIELTNKLLQTFSEVVEKDRVDFRNLNINYIMSAISTKIKNAMKIPKGTMLKCVKELMDSNKTDKILEKGKMYEVFGTYERNGFLTVYIINEKGSYSYYEYSYFEDLSTKRDDLLSMLLD